MSTRWDFSQALLDLDLGGNLNYGSLKAANGVGAV
jgi:hypothetical protein